MIFRHWLPTLGLWVALVGGCVAPSDQSTLISDTEDIDRVSERAKIPMRDKNAPAKRDAESKI